MYRHDKVRAAMAVRRISQEQFRDEFDIGLNTIRKVCSGDPEIKLKSLVRVCEALRLPMEEMFSPVPEEFEGKE